MLSARNTGPVLFLKLHLIIYIANKDLPVVDVGSGRVIIRRKNFSTNKYFFGLSSGSQT